MNPFANPEESITYEFPEFPAPEPIEVVQFEENSGSFVDFLHFLELPPESTTITVQSAVFQDFKEVLPLADKA